VSVIRPRAIARPLRHRGIAYAFVLYAMTAPTLATGLPIGMLPAYQESFHLSAGEISIVATGPTLGVVIAALLLGGLADAVGRKPVLLTGLAVSFVSTCLFVVASGFAELTVARVVAGIATALVVGAATAALTELCEGDTRVAATHAATSLVAALALGPIVAGALVEYGPWPLRFVFVLAAAALLPALLGTLVLPETVAQRRPFELRFRLGVPRRSRRVLSLAVLIAVSCFAATALFNTLGGLFVVQLLDVHNLFVAAIVPGAFLGASALAQVRFRRLAIRRSTLIGLTVLPVGLALVVAGVLTESVAFFIVGAAIGGFGQGLSYLGGQSLVEAATPAERRSEAFSLYLVVVYVAGGVSGVSLGYVANAVGLHAAAVGYGAMITALTLATGVLAVLGLRGAAAGGAPARPGEAAPDPPRRS
jgi:MFS family permease